MTVRSSTTIRRWLAAMAALLLPVTGAAETVSGYIRDAEDGEPLHFVTVMVEGRGLGGLSNEAGYYAVPGVPSGEQVVVFSHIGYATRRDTVNVTPAVPLRLDISLSPESILIETETIVRGERQQVNQLAQPSLLELQIQEVQKLPGAGEPDLLRSLQLLPGIQSASDISSGLYIRGGGPDQNLILLDQMPVYNPTHAFGFFSTFNPDAVKQASLLKGAYPAPYNGNLGAVLDVTNREGNHNAFSGRGGISLISARILAEGPVAQGGWMFSARRTYLDPVLAAMRRTGLNVPDYYFADFNGKLAQQLTEQGNLIVSGFLSHDDLRFRSDQETYFDLGWGNRVLSMRLEHVLTPDVFGRVLLGYSSYESTTEASFFDTPVLLLNGIRDLTLRADMDYFASPQHTWAIGVSGKSYHVDFDQSFNQQTLFRLAETPLMLSAYAQDEWQPDPLTTLRLGLRATCFSAGRDIAVMPRVGLSRALLAGLRLKASAGTYRQYIQLVSTEGFSGGDFWIPLDGSVNPGRASQGVVGLEWDVSRRYRATVEAYYSDLDDLVLLDNNVAVDSRDTRAEALFKTNGRGYATGLEIFVERRTGRLRGWAGYTLGRTRRRFAELNQGRSFAPKYDRRHDASFVLSYARGQYTWGASFVYGTGQAFTPAAARYSLRSPATGAVEDYVLPAPRNSARLLPYHRLDAGVRRAVVLGGAEAELYVQIFNLYSRRNEWFVQYDTDDPATKPAVVKMLPVVPTFGVDFSF